MLRMSSILRRQGRFRCGCSLIRFFFFFFHLKIKTLWQKLTRGSFHSLFVLLFWKFTCQVPLVIVVQHFERKKKKKLFVMISLFAMLMHLFAGKMLNSSATCLRKRLNEWGYEFILVSCLDMVFWWRKSNRQVLSALARLPPGVAYWSL